MIKSPSGSDVSADFTPHIAGAGAPVVSPLVLCDLEAGESACVVAVNSKDVDTSERLMEMGLVAGTRVSLVRYGLFGTPVQLQVRGYMLSLRRGEAASIEIKREP